MINEFEDRIPTRPNRFKLIHDVDDYYYIERADEPTLDGTPINAEIMNGILNEINDIQNEVNNTKNEINSRQNIKITLDGTTAYITTT